MGADDAIEAAIAGAYAAAFDQPRWAAWSDDVGRMLGGFCTTFAVADGDTGLPRHQSIHHPHERVIDEYRDLELWRIDPQFRLAAQETRPRIYLDTDHIDADDPDTREFLSWQAANAGQRHHMTASVTLGDGALVGGISVHRAVADGATPAAALRTMQAIFPEFTRAMQLSYVHADKLLDAYWNGLQAERAEPALLLDERARVRRATPALEAVLATGVALRLAGGRLTATDPASEAGLQAVIACGVQQAQPRGGAVRVARSTGGAPLIVALYPLPRATRMIAPFEAAALLVVIDPAAARPPAPQRWREAFGLTAREAELAALLLRGHSLESAAAVLMIADGTARIHLRRLLAKTGAARQAELVRLLARLG